MAQDVKKISFSLLRTLNAILLQIENVFWFFFFFQMEEAVTHHKPFCRNLSLLPVKNAFKHKSIKLFLTVSRKHSAKAWQSIKLMLQLFKLVPQII